MIVPPEGLILNVCKPQGITSFGVVRKIKHALSVKKVGHAGTLDPMAEGVLIVMVGKATKRAVEFESLTKEYDALIRLGISTDTYDITGNILSERDCSHISEDTINSALRDFIGEIEQIPPMYSALKIDGRKLYKLARQGIELERKPRRIKIDHIGLTDFNLPCFRIEVTCSKGTYIRSIAHDLGEKLGCGACLQELKRTAIGDFRIEDSLKLDEIYLD